jgi:hypothetical protein
MARGAAKGGHNGLDLEVSKVLTQDRSSNVRGRPGRNPPADSLQADRPRLVARPLPKAMDLPDLRACSLPRMRRRPMSESSKPSPPLPKCPVHDVFMHYRSGEFPRRFLFCVQCDDHWVECGRNLDDQYVIRRAFTTSR